MIDPVNNRNLYDTSRLDRERYIQPLDGRYDGFTTQSLNERFESERARINNADLTREARNQSIQDQVLANARLRNTDLNGSFANKNAPSLLERLNALDNPQAAKPAQQVSNNPLARLNSALQPSQNVQQNALFASLNRPDQGAAVTGPNALFNAQDLSGQVNINFSTQALQQRQQYVNNASLFAALANQGVDPRMAQAAIAAQMGTQSAPAASRMAAMGGLTQAQKAQASTELNEDKTGAGASRNGLLRKRMTDKMNAMLAKHQGSGLGQESGQPQQNMQQLAQQLRQRQVTPALSA